MENRYDITFAEGGVGVLETLLTGGIAIVIEKTFDTISGDDNHGWYCIVKDKISGVNVSCWGATKAEAQKKALEAIAEKIEDYEYNQEKQRQEEADRQKRLHEEKIRKMKQSGDDDDETSIATKLLAYAIVVALAVAAILWLALMAIILALTNLATITLVGGLLSKAKSKYLFPISILGAIYIVYDLNRNGPLSNSLTNNASFLTGVIPYFYYLNLLAGLVAAYFLIRDFLNRKKPPIENAGELSKRNLIVMGCLALLGGLVIEGQMYFDSKRINVVAQFTSSI